MTEFQRYALYYLPEGALADFGASWLGWDVMAGRDVAHPALAGLPRPVSDLTATPRKYGFHGTIKPPFRLAEGTDQDALQRAARTLCDGLVPVRMGGLRLTQLGRFLALVPDGDPASLTALAAQVVRTLDPFRAPASREELDRRRRAGLSPAEEDNLTRWGYPYVMDAFRFHLTLTGPIRDAAEREDIAAALRPALDTMLPCPFVFDTLCLTGADLQGRFHLIDRMALRGTA